MTKNIEIWECIPMNWNGHNSEFPTDVFVVAGDNTYDLSNERLYVEDNYKDMDVSSNIVMHRESETVHKTYIWKDGHEESFKFRAINISTCNRYKKVHKVLHADMHKDVHLYHPFGDVQTHDGFKNHQNYEDIYKRMKMKCPDCGEPVYEQQEFLDKMCDLFSKAHNDTKLYSEILFEKYNIGCPSEDCACRVIVLSRYISDKKMQMKELSDSNKELVLPLYFNDQAKSDFWKNFTKEFKGDKS